MYTQQALYMGPYGYLVGTYMVLIWAAYMGRIWWSVIGIRMSAIWPFLYARIQANVCQFPANFSGKQKW